MAIRDLFIKRYIPLEVCLKEEFPKSCNRILGNDMDSEVWPLVRILNLKGILTAGSCKGHYLIEGAAYKHPWITIYYNDTPIQKIMRLKEVLDKYNADHHIKWMVFPNNDTFPRSYMLKPAFYDGSIKELYDSIPALSKCIEDIF